MHVTEMLLTGYDDNEPVFAVSLVPGEARIVLTGETDETVKSAWQHATDAFSAVSGLIEDIVGASTPASS